MWQRRGSASSAPYEAVPVHTTSSLETNFIEVGRRRPRNTELDGSYIRPLSLCGCRTVKPDATWTQQPDVGPSSSDEESGWTRCVVDPSRSQWFDYWDVQMVAMLVCTAFITPYESAFLRPEFDGFFIFDRVTDVIFLIDMILQFFLAYPDARNPERMVKNHRRIVMHYLKGWFIVDFISLLPVDIICLLTGIKFHFWGLNTETTHEALRTVRLVRLLRLLRFTAIFDRWSLSFGFSYAWLTLMKFFTSVVFCCHWTACLWGGIALHLERCGENNWIAALKVSKGGEDEMYEHHFAVYGLSLYWSIVTLTSIGYGDITPQGPSEYKFATVCTSFMAAVWAYVIGSVCTIVSTLQPHEIFFKRTMDDLNWLLADRAIPPHLCRSLRRYFHEAREMNKQRVEESVIEQMSPMLQGEFSMFLHRRWISKVWYFKGMNREIIIWAARNLSLMIYAPNEEILEERTLFIVRRGMCAYRGRILTSGDIWGEDLLLSNEILRDRNNARSLSYLSVLRLHILDLFDVLVSFPEAKARLRMAQVKIALSRGIILIAKTVTFLQRQSLLKLSDLNFTQRCRLYADILSGDFDKEDVDTYLKPVSLTMPTKAASPMSPSGVSGNGKSVPPSPLHIFSDTMKGPRDAAAVLEQLAPTCRKPTPEEGGHFGEPSNADVLHAIERLQERLSSLEAKVDGTFGNPMVGTTTTGRRSHGRRDTKVLDIDFGPLYPTPAQGRRSLKVGETSSMKRDPASRRMPMFNML